MLGLLIAAEEEELQSSLVLGASQIAARSLCGIFCKG
jgi:hypothetical protein